MVRLTHPFPSLLDGAVVAAVAALAGAGPVAAIALGSSMTALQAGIGALNDVVDAPVDAGRKHAKPIPLGLVTVRGAKAVAVAAATTGVAVAALVAPAGAAVPMVGLAVIVLIIGVGYDLVAKGTAWSWLPFALGIPILPLYGWFGAVAAVPGWFAALYPMGVLAGTALSIANARADVERDRAAGIGSIAVRLGDAWAWRVHAALYVVAFVVASGYLALVDVGEVTMLIVTLPVIALAAAVALARDGTPERREQAWQLEALSVALFAIVWLAAVVA